MDNAEVDTLLKIVRDPVTLAPVDSSAHGRLGYLPLRAGGLTRKNEEEVGHFRRNFDRSLTPEQKAYSSKILSLPAPDTTSESVILDIGCGPYDCISAIPGRHIFLDDIMDLYVDELAAALHGVKLCARTELMPLANESVDLLYSVNMIDHVDDMPATMLEMFRILKSSGRVLMQTYFNSHPLLDTEPGVFDSFFVDEYVRPYFHIDSFETFAVGDPHISTTYTMDIAALVMRKRTDVELPPVDRARYDDPSFMGPQSRISVALGHLKTDEPDRAEPHIDALEAFPNYVIQVQLLKAFAAIQRDSLAEASRTLQDLLSEPRVRRNSFARIAIYELHQRRLNRAVSNMKAAASS